MRAQEADRRLFGRGAAVQLGLAGLLVAAGLGLTVTADHSVRAPATGPVATVRWTPPPCDVPAPGGAGGLVADVAHRGTPVGVPQRLSATARGSSTD